LKKLKVKIMSLFQNSYDNRAFFREGNFLLEN